MAILIMNDERVSSKGIDFFAAVGQTAQINLPVVGGILVNVTAETTQQPNFTVAVQTGVSTFVG